MRVSGAAPVFAALGDETRLGLVARLGSEGPLSITRLTERAGVSRQAITKHLCALSDAGLVKSRRRGRERIGSSSRAAWAKRGATSIGSPRNGTPLSIASGRSWSAKAARMAA